MTAECTRCGGPPRSPARETQIGDRPHEFWTCRQNHLNITAGWSGEAVTQLRDEARKRTKAVRMLQTAVESGCPGTEYAIPGCDRCDSALTVGYADDVCTQCPHVPLCADCLSLHAVEAAEDGTAK